MKIITKLTTVITIMILLHGCSPRKRSGNTGALDSLVQTDSVKSIFQEEDSIRESISQFEQRIKKVSPALLSWGFTEQQKVILAKRADFNHHWWLKIFSQKNARDTSNYPTAKDWRSLKAITQFSFKKSWKYIIEEWEFSDQHAARRWLNIALSTTNLDDAKPPRVYWVQGNKMHFIMATAARDWFEHGNELVKMFAGRNRALIELFNQPVALWEYKKKKEGANSGTWKKRTFYYEPDTIGSYFNYFWFIQLRSKYPSDVLFNGLVIKTYIYGTEIGYYEKVNEELIGIKSKLEDPDLKSLNLVGNSLSEILNLYGLSPSDKNLIIEEHDGDILLLHFNDGKIDWFNYIRTTLDLTHQKLPEELRYYEEVVEEENE